ncbi:MAG: flagellar biosynthesis anti-sigma factor FlgM [Nitrospira sp.]
MEISQNGRSADLAKILLGVHETERTLSKKTASQNAGTQDRVQISDQAKELQRLRAAAEQPNAERDAKVDHIRQEVEGGTYRVDGKQVADAMIRSVLTDSVL